MAKSKPRGPDGTVGGKGPPRHVVKRKRRSGPRVDDFPLRSTDVPRWLHESYGVPLLRICSRDMLMGIGLEYASLNAERAVLGEVERQIAREEKEIEGLTRRRRAETTSHAERDEILQVRSRHEITHSKLKVRWMELDHGLFFRGLTGRPRTEALKAFAETMLRRPADWPIDHEGDGSVHIPNLPLSAVAAVAWWKGFMDRPTVERVKRLRRLLKGYHLP
jgi:hypothetical protein